MDSSEKKEISFNDLLNMTLREVLENFSAIMSPECGYYYGIFNYEDINEIYANYNIDEEYPESFCPEPLINSELLDKDNPIGDYEKLELIMDNLGISKK